MKKRVLSLILAALLLLTAPLLLFGCGGASPLATYAYMGVYVDPAIESEYESYAELIEFIYEDTYLKLYEDGTWVIDTPLFLSFTSEIDKGTYTVEDGVYEFDGFEYDMDTYGRLDTDGCFEIYFMVPNGVDYTKAMSIYYGG